MDFFTTEGADGAIGVVVAEEVVVTGVAVDPLVVLVPVVTAVAPLPALVTGTVVVVEGVLPVPPVLVIVPLPVPALDAEVTVVDVVPAATVVVAESTSVDALPVLEVAAAVELVAAVESPGVPPDDWHPAISSESASIGTTERKSDETVRSSPQDVLGNMELIFMIASSRLLYLLQTSLGDVLSAPLLCANCDNARSQAICQTRLNSR